MRAAAQARRRSGRAVMAWKNVGWSKLVLVLLLPGGGYRHGMGRLKREDGVDCDVAPPNVVGSGL